MMSSYYMVGLTLLTVLVSSVDLTSVSNICDCTLRMNTCKCEDLSYIPQMWLNTSDVEIMYTIFSNLDNNFMINLTTIPLQNLTFVDCHFSKLSMNVFAGLKRLQRLRFATSYFIKGSLSNMLNSLAFTYISSLVLTDVYAQHWTEELSISTENTNLVHLTITRCSITTFIGNGLSSFRNLKTLDMSFNNILNISSWGHYPYLHTLDLHGNYIYKMPQFQNGSKGITVFPKLTYLSISLVHWETLDKYIFLGLNMLEVLHIDAPDLKFISPQTLIYLDKLRWFSLGSMTRHVLHLGKDAFQSSSIRSLTLKNFTIQISDYERALPFEKCRQINHLKLTEVDTRGKPSLNDILKLFTNLTYLEISNSVIKRVPDAVCNMTHLRKLILSGTRVRYWVHKNCHSMKSLRKISLARNHVYRFKFLSFSKALLQNTKLKWDLAYNEYLCDCELLWFRDWVRKYSHRMLLYPNHYICNSPTKIKSIRVADFYLTWDYCLNRDKPSVFSVAGITLGTLSIIFIICGVVSYVKRWSIRYLFYLVWARKRKYETLHNKIEYEYDAFVCYSGFDVRWVLNHLLPILEEEKHLHLCLHDRDFKVGHDIVDNIVESIQQSRKVVLILSAEFARSRWCQFEASLAQQRLLEEEKDVIVPILLNEIPSDIQTNRLALLLKKKTYLEWSEHQHGQKLFWERLIDILLEEPSYEEF